MEAILNSFILVAATEMGDKTQLLALVLASRFNARWAIMGGILVATIANHLLAASIGSGLASFVPPQILKWVIGLSSVLFALWVLKPDKEDELRAQSGWGPFLTTVIAFFLAEMGDKTQVSTMALAARYQNVALVTFGTTLGMMFSDGLAVFFGQKVTQIIPMKNLHRVAAALFVIFGVYTILA